MTEQEHIGVVAVGGFQERVAAALPALFHDDPTDIAERVARFFEEAVETCQALGLDFADAEKLVNYTYDRPVGEPAKEIGAALVTLASLCVVAGYDLAECGESDLEKLQRPETIARIRAKRATRHGRGPLPGLSPAAPTNDEDAECCIACEEPLEDGDPVYWDVNDTGHIHAACCGPERESYVNSDGEPLKDGEPIPEPFAWRPER